MPVDKKTVKEVLNEDATRTEVEALSTLFTNLPKTKNIG